MNYFPFRIGIGVTVVAALALLWPTIAAAQNTARIECGRADGYVYLYRSVATLDVITTLQCGEMVQVIGREESYLEVRSAKGDTGFVPGTNATILKDRVGPAALSEAAAPARERIVYDKKPAVVAAPAPAAAGFLLANNTPVKLRLVKGLSSATAHVGDAADMEVTEAVTVDGVTVIAKGAKVKAAVAVAEPKKRFGKSGRLAVRVTSVEMVNGEQAAVRCYQEVSGTPSTSSEAVVPLGSGKDATLLEGAEFTGLVDGDVKLKRENF